MRRAEHVPLWSGANPGGSDLCDSGEYETTCRFRERITKRKRSIFQKQSGQVLFQC